MQAYQPYTINFQSFRANYFSIIHKNKARSKFLSGPLPIPDQLKSDDAITFQTYYQLYL